MPRGLRAVHGHEREGSVGPQAMDTLVTPAAKTLVGVCWCGLRFLRLAQRDVLDGITYSCNSPLCVDADGNHVEGDVIKRYLGMPTAVEGVVGHWANPEFTRFRLVKCRLVALRYTGEDRPPIKPTRRIVPQIKREARASRDEVRNRRYGVEHLWKQGKDVAEIARQLDCAAATVRNDLTLLQIRMRDANPLRFDWVKWLNGAEWVLVQGRDFFCSATTLIEHAHTVANALGVPCRTSNLLPRVVVINGRDR